MAETITPNDIVNKEFRLALRGYSTEEVDDFLQVVSDNLFRAMEEIKSQRVEMEALRERIRQYEEAEDVLKRTLMLAERTADEVRQQAHQEAALLKREAQEEIRAEKAELEEVHRAGLRMIADLRGVLYSQLALIESHERRLFPSAAMEEKQTP